MAGNFSQLDQAEILIAGSNHLILQFPQSD